MRLLPQRAQLPRRRPHLTVIIVAAIIGSAIIDTGIIFIVAAIFIVAFIITIVFVDFVFSAARRAARDRASGRGGALPDGQRP